MRGQRRTSCIWFNYTTDLDYKTSPFPIMSSEYNGVSLTSGSNGFLGSTTCSDCSAIILTEMNSSNIRLNSNTVQNLELVDAEGTTRGIGNKFVELSCSN